MTTYRLLASSARLAAILLGVAGTAASPASMAASTPHVSDRAAITDLIYCYARANDSIGDATTNADPLAKGLSIYRQCVAEDVEVRAWFPQRPFNSQAFPDPNAFPESAPPVFKGIQAWAEHVNEVFRSGHYRFTQHAISNVQVSVEGNRGRLTAYLTATLVVPGTEIAGPSQCVAVANGTFSAETKRRDGRWWITKLNVALITFNKVFQSGKGC